MAQIKVLDLYNSDSISELSYKDTKKVNGGYIGYCKIINIPIRKIPFESFY